MVPNLYSRTLQAPVDSKTSPVIGTLEKQMPQPRSDGQRHHVGVEVLKSECYGRKRPEFPFFGTRKEVTNYCLRATGRPTYTQSSGLPLVGWPPKISHLAVG